MKTLNLIVGLSLGLTLAGCPGDDGSEEGGGTVDPDTGPTTTMTPTTTGVEETTTSLPEDTTTTGDPDTTNGDPDTTTGDPDTTTDEPGTTTGEAALSFETDVYPIMEANCSCHIDGSPGMLAMPDAATAYGNLVGVPSANGPNNDNRVEPGDPAASFFWNKLIDDLAGGEGGPMPQGAMMLPQEELDTIEQWINEGAEP